MQRWTNAVVIEAALRTGEGERMGDPEVANLISDMELLTRAMNVHTSSDGFTTLSVSIKTA